MMLKLLQEFAACYIILTLTATSLAKVRNWRTAAIALLREEVIPPRIAPITIIFISVVELLLAAFLCLGMARVPIAGASAALFVLFGAYRLTVAVKTKSMMCACAGYARYNPATPQAFTAIILTSISQAAAAFILMFPAAGYGAENAALVRSMAWTLPFAVLIIAAIAARTIRSGRFSLGRSFPVLARPQSRGR